MEFDYACPDNFIKHEEPQGLQEDSGSLYEEEGMDISPPSPEWSNDLFALYKEFLDYNRARPAQLIELTLFSDESGSMDFSGGEVIHFNNFKEGANKLKKLNQES